MDNYFDFTGKKYMITGASSGIGRATAIELSKRGAEVVLIGRNKKRLEETKALLRGENAITIAADLCETQQLQDIFDMAMEDSQKMDGVVHCAGIDLTAALVSLDKGVFDEMMHINIYVLLEMVRLFAKKKYHNSNSSIVAISSIAALNPGKCQTIYAAAKAGMNAAVQALAQELAVKKIRINTVMPALTKTRMYFELEEQLGSEQAKCIANNQLLGLAEPEEIANTILFLLSDASSVITGRAMYTDSGTL